MRIGIGPNMRFSSSPPLAVLGSRASSEAVRSNSSPTGAVSALLSIEENGKDGREVSSSSRLAHGVGPDASLERQPKRPISALGEFPTNSRCLVGSLVKKRGYRISAGASKHSSDATTYQPLSHPMNRLPFLAASPNAGAGSIRYLTEVI